MSEEKDHFHIQPELDFDPEKVQNPPTEEEERAREASQSFWFREKVFIGSLYLCFFLFIVWLILIFNWPTMDENQGNGVYYLYGLKLSLCSVILVTAVVSTLRFAIQCYGHHQQSPTSGMDNSSVSIIGKFLEQIGKTIQSSSSQ